MGTKLDENKFTMVTRNAIRKSAGRRETNAGLKDRLTELLGAALLQIAIEYIGLVPAFKGTVLIWAT